MANLLINEITRCLEYADNDGANTDEAVMQLFALVAENGRLRAENAEWYERDKRDTL